ncbi:unnamed protein product (mitochondrion) [Plasmodiophora brassicae]|uniref:RGS domain-containing protein n=1 Tax=Plasmodiophora brassicae TaxID=37360 RepID=A0A0G4IJQ5_PLABS|nr:hypothetical protein PBRA_004078 [Plasmodiophora brassicae]SPQ96241.1 unnamed protein product [Plasmodiophora brassicae]
MTSWSPRGLLRPVEETRHVTTLLAKAVPRGTVSIGKSSLSTPARMGPEQVVVAALACVCVVALPALAYAYMTVKKTSFALQCRRPHTLMVFAVSTLPIVVVLSIAHVYPSAVQPVWALVIVWQASYSNMLDSIVVIGWHYWRLWSIHRRLTRVGHILPPADGSVTTGADDAMRHAMSATDAVIYEDARFSASHSQVSIASESTFIAVSHMCTTAPLAAFVDLRRSTTTLPSATLPSFMTSTAGIVVWIYMIARSAVFLVEMGFILVRVRQSADGLGIRRSLVRCCAIVGVAMTVMSTWLALAMHQDANLSVAYGLSLPSLLMVIALWGELLLHPVVGHWRQPPPAGSVHPESSSNMMALFHRFLLSDEGFRALMQFATREFSTENLVFIAEVTKFERMWDARAPTSRQGHARLIMQQFLLNDGAMPVTVSRAAIPNGTVLHPHMFTAAKTEVIHLVFVDTFSRFRAHPAGSKLWNEFVARELEVSMVASRRSSESRRSSQPGIFVADSRRNSAGPGSDRKGSLPATSDSRRSTNIDSRRNTLALLDGIIKAGEMRRNSPNATPDRRLSPGVHPVEEQQR